MTTSFLDWPGLFLRRKQEQSALATIGSVRRQLSEDTLAFIPLAFILVYGKKRFAVSVEAVPCE
jgi:hypothetical protein